MRYNLELIITAAEEIDDALETFARTMDYASRTGFP
jgi:hypothetical protein